MIGHIFLTDVRLLWKYALGVALVGFLGSLLGLETHEDHAWNQAWSLLQVVKVLATGLLIAAAVQQDPVPGFHQDWVVRPIVRRDLIAAKLLFVVVMVQAPVLIADIAQLLAGGFPPGQSFRAALIRALTLLGAYYLPVLGIAAITRNFTETVIGAAACLLGFAVLAQVWGAGAGWHWRHVTFAATGTDWIATLGMIGVAAAGGGAILALQYLKRETARARWLAAGVVVLCFGVNLAPWRPVFALQQRLSAQPGGASAVQLAFEPGRGRLRRTADLGVSAHARNNTFLYLPISISGLGADSILRTDLVEARLTTPEGKVETLGFARVPLEMREGPAKAGLAGGPVTVMVPTELYHRYRGRNVRLDLDYSLSLLRLSAAHAMPAVHGSQRIREFGRCRTWANLSAFTVMLTCEQAAMTPPCATVFLEHPRTGWRNPETVVCSGSYSPVSLVPEPDPMRRLRIGLGFRDAPVGGEDIGEAQVVTRWYEVVEHFARHVQIPGIRLSDWLPL
jgi:hypothetical protein